MPRTSPLLTAQGIIPARPVSAPPLVGGPNPPLLPAQDVPTRPASAPSYSRRIFALPLTPPPTPNPPLVVRCVPNAHLPLRPAPKPSSLIRPITSTEPPRNAPNPPLPARPISNPPLPLRLMPQSPHKVRPISNSALPRQPNSNLHISQWNTSSNFALLLLVRHFLLSGHPGESCLVYLDNLLHDLGIDAASYFIQALYHIPGALPCLWFSPATDSLVAQLLFRYTTAALLESNWPWDARAAAFVYQLIILTCGPPFYERSGGNSGAVRCREVFRQCVQEMDTESRIYCFWLFTHTELAVTMTFPLFKDLISLQRGTH